MLEPFQPHLMHLQAKYQSAQVRLAPLYIRDVINLKGINGSGVVDGLSARHSTLKSSDWLSLRSGESFHTTSFDVACNVKPFLQLILAS